MKKPFPGVDSQSREDIRRRSRRLEDKAAMMLERERERDTEGRVSKGQGHSEYNYQLNSMMTCPCEKTPPFLATLWLAPCFFSLSCSVLWEH